jgi:hypothetical protein
MSFARVTAAICSVLAELLTLAAVAQTPPVQPVQWPARDGSFDIANFRFGDGSTRDPAWAGGEYASEPALGLSFANELFLVMGSAPLQMQKNFPTRVAAEAYVDAYVARTAAATDANDMIYYTDASRMPHARFVLIPISDATRGHGTHTQASVWVDKLREFIAETEPQP